MQARSTRKRSDRRRVSISTITGGGVAVAAALLITLAAALFSGRPATGADERLPDLAMAPLADFTVDERDDGRRFLRFSATIVNVGDGALEVRGRRIGSAASSMGVSQMIETSDGARSRATAATMTYAGDGHDHWHVHDVMRYDLSTPDGARAASEKTGFCFWDNRRHDPSLADAPPDAVYEAVLCGDAQSRRNSMGLSVGWGDRYRASLAWQWIEITGLADGRYVVTAEADPLRLFAELDDENNCTTAVVDVEGRRATLVETRDDCATGGASETHRPLPPRLVRAGCLLALVQPDAALPCPSRR